MATGLRAGLESPVDGVGYVGSATNPARVLDELSTCVSEDFDIEQSTFQLETADRSRIEQASHR